MGSTEFIPLKLFASLANASLAIQDMICFAESIQSQFVWVPIVPFETWWHFLLAAVVVLLVMAWITRVTFRDRHDQPLGVVVTIWILRLMVVAVLVGFTGNLVRQRDEVRRLPSRIDVILDNSLSMNLPSGNNENVLRNEEVAACFEDFTGWKNVLARHELRFFRLDADDKIVELGTVPISTGRPPKDSQNVSAAEAIPHASIAIALGLLTIGGVLLGLVIWCRSKADASGWLLAAATLFVLTGWGFLLVADVRSEKRSILFGSLSGQPNDNGSIGNEDPSGESLATETFSADSLRALISDLQGDQPTSPLGEAILQRLTSRDSDRLAAICLFSDGGLNAGIGWDGVVREAGQSRVPIFAVGFGSNEPTRNLRFTKVTAPKKVFAGNPFEIRGDLIAEVDRATDIEVVLSSIDAGNSELPPSEMVEEKTRTVSVTPATQRYPITFQFQRKPIGKRRYIVTARPLPNEANAEDNSGEATVEVVDRRSKILLFAGGPSREFRFLRNQLFRDTAMTVDVLLQSAESGADQEGNKVLAAFPDDSELEQYDCVVAFDPDWSLLTRDQSNAVRSWVASEAGGLIVVAGPVNTPVWTSRPRNDPVVDPIRDLYPVDFFSQSSGVIKLGRFGGAEAFPLAFQRSAAGLDFLRFSDDPIENSKLWDSVLVYGYYAVSQEKAGAKVLAHFSDPATSFAGEFPIYFASQMYGAGRVFFQASGEMWRTRRVGPEFFEQYYTRLIRWSSQGRLLRDSEKLSLLLDQDEYLVGDNAAVQAILRDPTPELQGLETLTLESLQIQAGAKSNGVPELIPLRRFVDGSQNLVFSGSWRVSKAGQYKLRLVIPETTGIRTATKSYWVRIPDLELENPSRRDDEMERMAKETDGKYIVCDDRLAAMQNLTDDLAQTPGQETESISALPVDKMFTRRLMAWYLATCFFCLSFCWLVRRLNRLA